MEKQGIFRSFSRISLHTKLIIAFLAIAIIPLLFASVITTKIVEDSVSRSVFEKNQNLADTTAQQLNADFDGKIRTLTIASEDPDIRSMDPTRQTQVLRDILAQYPDMGMAAISDANGTQTARSDGMPNSSITYTDREYFQRLKKTGNTTVSDVLKAKSSDRIVIVIAEPIRNDDQTIRGALLVNVELNKLVAHIAETRIGRTGYAYVVNKDGKVIIHPDSGVVANATDLSYLAPVKAAISGNSGWAEYESGGQTKLAGYSYVPITGWGLVAEQPLEEAMSDVTAIRNANILIMAGTVIIAFLIILALAGALFRPIALLTAAAGKAAHGDLTVQARVVSEDEIGTLASAFNTMVDRIRIREEALQESHRRLEDIINFLPDPTFVIDLEGKIIAWNRATEEMTGIRARDILFKGNFEHGLAFYGERHPILIDQVLDEDKKTTKKYQDFQKIGNKFIGAGYFPTAYGGKGADIVATASPLYTTKGDIAGAIETIRDITDKKRAEESLRESERKFRAIFDQTFQFTGLMTLDGTLLEANRSALKLAGIQESDILGRPFWETPWWTHSTELQEKLRAAIQVAAKGAFVRFNATHPAADGSLHEIDFSIKPVLDEAGRIVFLIPEGRDITDQKRAQDALDHATRKLTLLNSITFTDIKNAVFSLSGYQELEKTLPLDEKQQQYLEKQIRIVRKITESLKFADNYQNLGIRPPAWQNVQQSFLIAISHLDISHLFRNFSVEGLEIYADPLLENVFLTLAENVVMHGKTATEIAFRYHESPEGLTLFFEDNGAGIAPGMKERIFCREYEEKKGMGLFLAREILSITGITIRETGGPGKGARFEIVVPKGGYRFIGSR